MTLTDGRKWIIASAAAVLALGAAAWTWHSVTAPAPLKLVYSPAGYGGFVPPRSAPPSAPPGKTPSPKSETREERAATRITPADMLKPALKEFDAGRYRQAAAAAQQVIDSTPKISKSADRFPAVQARELMAYSAARSKDMKLARRLFAAARVEAANLPDGGKPVEIPGEEPQPAITEDAVYQHAVCTAALGDKVGAESEYVSFMKQYPESPLVQASIKRIARMYGGNIPPADEAVWKQAMTIATARANERQREESLCGPECLARVLQGIKPGARSGVGEPALIPSALIPDPSPKPGRREQGYQVRPVDDQGAVSVEALAREMKTDGRGTTVEALVDAACRHGLNARGLRVTMQGLQEQRLPLIALVTPGHFVILEKAGVQGVRYWDPTGPKTGVSRSCSVEDWQRMWDGVVVAL